MKSQAKTRLLLALVLLLANGFPALNRVALALMRGTTQQRTAAPPPPRGIERVRRWRASTNTRLANGLRVLPAARAEFVAYEDREHDLPRRLNATRSRRDGDGAPARASDLQRHAEGPEHSGGTESRGSRINGTTWYGSDELLRDLRRLGRKSKVGARARSRTDGEFLHREKIWTAR